jgi:hypothetical protein
LLGYGFGKYRGASEIADELEQEGGASHASSGTPAKPSSQAGADAMQTVYVRRGGSHYHRESCRHLRRKGGEPMTKAEARKKHYRQCPSCRA